MFPFDFSSQDSCDNTAIFGGVMVAVGVALEVFDLIEKIRNRNKSILVRESVLLLFVEFASISLVVSGLALEIFATHRSSTFAHIKSDDLTSQLKAAMDSIGLQSTNISQLRELNGVLTKQVDATQTQLTNAEARLIELQTTSEPMIFSKNQGVAFHLAQNLRKAPGVSVELFREEGANAFESSRELGQLFSAGGWHCNERVNEAVWQSQHIYSGNGANCIFRGITIMYNKDDQKSKMGARVLMNILMGSKLPTEFKPGILYGEIPTNSIVVVVGERPSAIEAKVMYVSSQIDELNFQLEETPFPENMRLIDKEKPLFDELGKAIEEESKEP